MSKVSLKLESSPSHTYFASLDGFRGLLALFVALYHTIWISHPQTWRFFENGAVVIDLFFAFSGFLMWRLYMDRLETASQTVAFMKRRFARLYPLHFFMLTIFLVFALVRVMAHKFGFAEQTEGEILPFQAGASDNWVSLFQNLTLTNAMGFSDDLTFNPTSWTVGAEFYTYIIFAAMMMWFRPKKLMHFIALLVTVVAIYAWLSLKHANMNITYDDGFMRCVAGFFTGVLASASFPKIRGLLDRLSVTWATILEMSVLAICVLFVIFVSARGQFLAGIFIFLFVSIFAADKGVISKIMSHSIFQYLAKISYSVYLVHVIIAIIFAVVLERILGQLPTEWVADFWLAIYLCVVIAVSHCTYHLIECPGGRLIRSLNWPQKQVAKAVSSV